MTFGNSCKGFQLNFSLLIFFQLVQMAFSYSFMSPKLVGLQIKYSQKTSSIKHPQPSTETCGEDQNPCLNQFRFPESDVYKPFDT